jgi:dolichol-phosphate mannosyltransferase
MLQDFCARKYIQFPRGFHQLSYFFSLEMSKIDPEISIVIPTYEEQENIPILLGRIFKVLQINRIRGEIIIVDDNSQDGTIDEINKYPVKLIVRKKERGLALSCMEGFKFSQGEIIVVMDADLQHPPERIPALIDTIKNGSDIAIGSRYVEGGSPRNWGWGRKIISKGASILAGVFFSRIQDIKDKGSGFFAFKKEVIQGIQLKPIGYKILLEILVCGRYDKIQEVGFEFGQRIAGRSKLGPRIIFFYIFHLMRLLRLGF